MAGVTEAKRGEMEDATAARTTESDASMVSLPSRLPMVHEADVSQPMTVMIASRTTLAAAASTTHVALIIRLQRSYVKCFSELQMARTFLRVRLKILRAC